MEYDLIVFIGRFQPFHNSHRRVLDTALQRAKQVLVLIGSAGEYRNVRNPWTAGERETMLRHVFPEAVAQSRLFFAAIPDRPYSDETWLRLVQAAVSPLEDALGPNPRIGIIGHDKDHSSYYLRMFPQWTRVPAPDYEGRSATDLRDLFFGGDGLADAGTRMLLESAVPGPVFAFLNAFRSQPAYDTLVEEYRFLRRYREQFAAAPYPPVFVTVDAVVVHSGHILLIQRRALPGKGLWALPGGFVGQDESLLDAAVRELREETRLKIPAPVLKGSIRANRVFDRPDRSLRGRTITHAWYFEFPAGELPAVRGGDDAAKARWVPLAEFYAMEGSLFEDHWHIATSFIGME